MANLNDLEVTNGKDFADRQKALEELLGVDKISPFGTYDLEIFERELKLKSHTDLQTLAQRVGLNPFLDKSRIKASLIREFKEYTKNSRKNLVPQISNQMTLDRKDPKHAEIMKILGDL